MTDVVVQHLLSDEVTRIKCRDLIKRIAIYKNKLAVRTSIHFQIYSSLLLYNAQKVFFMTYILFL